MNKKKLKEFILYLIFGVLTTLVSIGVFGILNKICMLNEHISNIISWIVAVSFAFFTNRSFVFHAKTRSASHFIEQLLSFFSSRLFTLVIEEIIIYVFVTRLCFDSLIIKTTAQILVIILNYILSKLIVFRKRKNEECLHSLRADARKL